MYLHELGDGAGSFTKDDMQAGFVFHWCSFNFLVSLSQFSCSLFNCVTFISLSLHNNIILQINFILPPFFRKHQEYEQQLIAFYSKKM